MTKDYMKATIEQEGKLSSTEQSLKRLVDIYIKEGIIYKNRFGETEDIQANMKEAMTFVEIENGKYTVKASTQEVLSSINSMIVTIRRETGKKSIAGATLLKVEHRQCGLQPCMFLEKDNHIFMVTCSNDFDFNITDEGEVGENYDRNGKYLK